jgi:hypothetical protein
MYKFKISFGYSKLIFYKGIFENLDSVLVGGKQIETIGDRGTSNPGIQLTSKRKNRICSYCDKELCSTEKILKE